MAWQNSGAMVGNGGSAGGGSEASGNNGQPHGTEYTLQGTESIGLRPIRNPILGHVRVGQYDS